MGSHWRNGAKLPWELATVGSQLPGRVDVVSMLKRCSVYLSAPVSQWGQVRIRCPIAPDDNTTSSREQLSPGARLAADNDVASGRVTAFGTGLEQVWVDATGEAQRGTA